MPDNICKKIDFAKVIKRSRQFVQKSVESGMVDVVGKGRAQQINLDGARTIQFIALCRENDELKQGKAPAPVETKKRKKTPSTSEVIGADIDDLTDVGTRELGNLSKLSLDRLKSAEDIMAKRQKRAELRKELVSREGVRRVLSKLFMLHINQLRTLAQSITPEIASIFGSDNPEQTVQASTVIDKEVYKILGQIQRLFNDWLKENEAEEIKSET